jgi:ribosomal protein L44E
LQDAVEYLEKLVADLPAAVQSVFAKVEVHLTCSQCGSPQQQQQEAVMRLAMPDAQPKHTLCQLLNAYLTGQTEHWHCAHCDGGTEHKVSRLRGLIWRLLATL